MIRFIDTFKDQFGVEPICAPRWVARSVGSSPAAAIAPPGHGRRRHAGFATSCCSVSSRASMQRTTPSTGCARCTPRCVAQAGRSAVTRSPASCATPGSTASSEGEEPSPPPQRLRLPGSSQTSCSATSPPRHPTGSGSQTSLSCRLGRGSRTSRSSPTCSVAGSSAGTSRLA